MLIGGLQKFTLIDYPGKIAASVFTIGCNFSCGFCHNPEFVDIFKMKQQTLISEEIFFEFLKSRQGDLDGVCVSGGEPTLQKDLPEFLQKIKDMDFFVKLDTNGSNSKMLEYLINENLVDYIAMDIKGSLDKYLELSNSKINLTDIENSVRLIQAMPDYEFRTTILPRFHTEEDVLNIARWLKGSKKYFLQQFRPGKTLDVLFENELSYPQEKLEEFLNLINPYFDYCGIRD